MHLVGSITRMFHDTRSPERQIYRVVYSYDSTKRNIWRDFYEEREQKVVLAHHWDLVVILSLTRFCFLLRYHLRRHLVYGPSKHESCTYWVSRLTDLGCYVTEFGVFWAWETWYAKNCIHRDAFLSRNPLSPNPQTPTNTHTLTHTCTDFSKTTYQISVTPGFWSAPS